MAEFRPVSTKVIRQSEMSVRNSFTSRSPPSRTKSFDRVSS